MSRNRIDSRAIIIGDVRLGSDNVVDAGAVLVGPIDVGDGNYFGPNCVVGAPPQDDAVSHHLRRDGLTAGSDGQLSIGNGNVFREFVTIHRGLTGGTIIGDGCYVMAYSHVAHDCVVRDQVKIANNVQMGGYTWLGRGVYVGLSAVLHQFTVVGGFSMVGMGAVVTMGAVPPGSLLYGSPARLIRPNSVGLDRLGVEDISWWADLARGSSDAHVPLELRDDMAEFRSIIDASEAMRTAVTAWRAQRSERQEGLQ